MSTFKHLTSVYMLLPLLKRGARVHLALRRARICVSANFHYVLLQLGIKFQYPFYVHRLKIFKRTLYKHILHRQIYQLIFCIFCLDFRLFSLYYLEFLLYMLRGTFERSLRHFKRFRLLFSILRIKVFIIIIITIII